MGLDGTTPVNSRIPGENSPVAHPHPKSGAKSALPCGKATKRGKKEAKHVPLDSGLAKIVSLELASDEGSPKKLKQSKTCPRKSKAAALAESNKATLQAMQQQSGQINRTTTPIVAPSSQPISHLHQLPMPLPSNASLLAARLAEEQEAVAMFLHQRQQQSHIHLEQLHLEQMRRMQTAMWLYQHSGSPSGTSLPYLESLIAGRQIPGKLASDMIPQGHLSGVVQLNQSVGYSEPKSSKTVVSTAGASGANPSLLSLAPKRGLEANKEKPIKERPEEYQHLSKKAKRSPLQLAVTVQPSSRSNTDNDYDSDCSDPEKNGHRFRPYQYEQWTEKFQELCDFRKHKGHW